VEGDLTLAHILPHSTEARIQQIVGIVKKLDNFRKNLMWLCSGLEVAFDQKQISLEPVDALTRTVFKVRVWENDILEKPLYPGASENISSIVDRIIDFSSSFDKNTIPYRRCLSYHAMMCYFTNIDRFGAEAFKEVSKESAGDWVDRLRRDYLDVYLSQSQRENLEEGDDDDEDEEGGDVELVHQKPLRSKANKKRTGMLTIQELRRKFQNVKTTDRRT
jgi:hypothetical protein